MRSGTPVYNGSLGRRTQQKSFNEVNPFMATPKDLDGLECMHVDGPGYLGGFQQL